MLKKIIITLTILFLLGAGALTAFVLTFDAERYKPLIETKAAELTGFPVTLGGVSLTWKNGLALEIRDFALKIHEGDDLAPLSASSAYVALEVMPLLKGTLQMGALIIENPEVRITRSPDGRLRGAAELAAANPQRPAKGPSGAESTLALLIQNLHIRGGKFVFQDQYGGRVREYTVEQIELRLKNVSLLRPFPVEFNAALLSGKQNVTLTGNVHAKLAQQEVQLRDFVLRADLDTLDAEKISQAFPELRESGVPAMNGQIWAELADLVLNEKAQPVLNAKVGLTGGRFAVDGVEPVENAVLEANVTAQGLDAKNISADWAGGHLISSLKADWRTAPFTTGSFQAELSGLDLTRVAPPSTNPRDPGVNGILSASTRGTFAGADAESMTRGVAGEGQVLIKEFVITNLNVLREVLNKLSIIPGVAQKIQEGLSEEYLAKLEERDTRLEDVELPFRLADGFLFADSIFVKSDTFQIQGQAQAVLSQGPLAGRLFAAIDSELSLALMRSVRELEYIADAQGQITVPLVLRGTLQAPQAVPELQQLASRLAAFKAQELISGFLNKNKPSETGTAEGSADQGEQPLGVSNSASSYSQQNAQQQPTDPFASLLGQVLQAAVKKNTPTHEGQ